MLNVSEEDIAKNIWEKLGNFYQSKSHVNKFFLRNKLYIMRMGEGDSIIENLNALNIVID